MAVKTFRPLTPSQRYIAKSSFDEITKVRPEKSLLTPRRRSGGRNSYGRVTARGIGGGAKQMIRNVDFKRKKHGVEASVLAIEYDPIRSARLALIQYTDGEKRYIIAPVGLNVGAKVSSGEKVAAEPGNAMPLKSVPVGMEIHNLEMVPGRGGQMVRSAGSSARVMSIGEGFAQVRLPSGEVRRIQEACYATIGQVGNTDHEKQVWGKAGISRHHGVRPITRGVARNPVDHPLGGGQGKSKGGGGRQHLVSPWGVLAKGFRTRLKKKQSNRFILVRRDGRPMKRK